MDDPATTELLDRWVRGDAEAGGEIYQRYVKRVERYAMKFTKDTVHAEEVAAEAMAQGLAGTREGKQPDRFTFWLLGITKNLAVMRHRAARRQSPLQTDHLAYSPGPGPGTLQVRGEMARVLGSAIEKLPPSCREVVELYKKENLDRGAIAERLGVQRETVDRRFARAYRALREEIQNHVTTVVTGPRRLGWEDVRGLRPGFRQTVLLRHVEGLTPEEIADTLGVPLETVHARLSTAYAQLGVTPGADFGRVRREYQKTLE